MEEFAAFLGVIMVELARLIFGSFSSTVNMFSLLLMGSGSITPSRRKLGDPEV